MLSGDDTDSDATMWELQAGSIKKKESRRQHNLKHKYFCFSIIIPGNEKLRVFS